MCLKYVYTTKGGLEASTNPMREGLYKSSMLVSGCMRNLGVEQVTLYVNLN